MKYFLLVLFLILIPAALAAAPTVGTVTVTDPVNLNAGSTKAVTCEATVSDGDGWANITTVNATIWRSSSTEASADDNNDHYTNTSCNLGANTSATDMPATCTFSLQYYAKDGTWTCKIRAYDDSSSGSNETTTTVNELVALSVPASMNFGTLNLGDTSTNDSEVEFSVENKGNVQIDAQVSGNNMACASGTIPIGNIRYDSADNTSYDLMTTLTTGAVTVDLNITKSTGSPSSVLTYWRVQIPSSGVGGSCSNTITFTAVSG